MSAYSKSLITNTYVPASTRLLYNPVDKINGNGGDFLALNVSFIKTLKYIEEFYVRNMANKQYEKIPNDYQKYVNLYVILQQVLTKTKNSNLVLLFKIAQEALVGAINSYTIYGDNLLLKLDKTNLQNKINEILSNKNEKVVEMANSTGQLTLNKTFKLAPVFNNYILIYGLPAFGVGFDPAKIKFLEGVLKKMGINPYK
jgi:hypothetical protein